MLEVRVRQVVIVRKLRAGLDLDDAAQVVAGADLVTVEEIRPRIQGGVREPVERVRLQGVALLQPADEVAARLAHRRVGLGRRAGSARRAQEADAGIHEGARWLGRRGPQTQQLPVGIRLRLHAGDRALQPAGRPGPIAQHHRERRRIDRPDAGPQPAEQLVVGPVPMKPLADRGRALHPEPLAHLSDDVASEQTAKPRIADPVLGGVEEQQPIGPPLKHHGALEMLQQRDQLRERPEQEADGGMVPGASTQEPLDSDPDANRELVVESPKPLELRGRRLELRPELFGPWIRLELPAHAWGPGGEARSRRPLSHTCRPDGRTWSQRVSSSGPVSTRPRISRRSRSVCRRSRATSR